MSQPALRCRKIVTEDLGAVIALLTPAFDYERDRMFWERAMDRLSRHATPPGYPRYGYVLDHGGEVVGVVLQIFSQVPGTSQMRGSGVRCSMSSWFVLPAFRAYASLLVSRALRHPATYTNDSPGPPTWPLLEAQGYARYCDGRVLTPLWLVQGSEAARVSPFTEGMAPDAHLTAGHIAVLRDHAAYGCISLVCEAAGRRHPFVFLPRRRLGVVNVARLVYCTAEATVPRFAAALGRHLARRGFPLAALDANGPLPGVPGLYSGNHPKFFRGPDRPRTDDHAYSERAMFGV